MNALDNGIYEAGVVLAFTAFVSFFSRRLLSYIRKSTNENVIIQDLSEILYSPSIWLIWTCGVLSALEALSEPFESYLPKEGIPKIRNLFLIIAVTWLLFKWKNLCILHFGERLNTDKKNRKIDKALIDASGQLSSIFILVIAGLMLLDVFGVPLEVFLTFGGIGGLGIGLAGKDVIANFFGGFMIYVNRPFAVGEWIKSPNKNFEGVVEEIGWYMTKIRTFERRPTYIPNALMTDAIIENPGRMYNRRIKATIGVRYSDVKKVKVIVEDITAMLKNHIDVAQDQIMLVDWLTFGPSSLDIEVYTFLKTTNWKEYRRVQQDVFLKIAEIVDSHGAEIAFPTQTLHIQKEFQEE